VVPCQARKRRPGALRDSCPQPHAAAESLEIGELWKDDTLVWLPSAQQNTDILEHTLRVIEWLRHEFQPIEHTLTLRGGAEGDSFVVSMDTVTGTSSSVPSSAADIADAVSVLGSSSSTHPLQLPRHMQTPKASCASKTEFKATAEYKKQDQNATQMRRAVASSRRISHRAKTYAGMGRCERERGKRQVKAIKRGRAGKKCPDCGGNHGRNLPMCMLTSKEAAMFTHAKPKALDFGLVLKRGRKKRRRK
jgi:hypothetical protein